MLLNLRCQTGKHQHMPRQERTKSATGIYHVMLRGINKQDIFVDHESPHFSKSGTDFYISE